MSPPEPRDCAIAVVGGGYSGLLVAVQLFRNGFRGRITVIEPREQLGMGLAYSTLFDQHLLNVPAGKMSALPGQPAHFLEWLRARHCPDADGGSFAPRRLYGEYLHDLLRKTIPASAYFSHIRAEATGIETDDAGRARLTLGDGTSLHAEKVVLALGNPASSSPADCKAYGLEDRWHLSPWFGDALRVRFAGERILVLGSGLTAVDSVLALQSQGVASEVIMMSRSGILPQAHNFAVPAARPTVLRNRGNLRLLLRELRAHVETARQSELCWRTVVDGLRPVSNDIWQELTAADRQRFLRHLKRYWEPHRHRMAPQIRARLDEYQASGALQILAGRLQDVRSTGGVSTVRILMKQGRERRERTFDVHRIISCTGIHESYTARPRPLIRSLIGNGLALPNDLGIGFRTDGHGALLDSKSRPSSIFFTLGPPRRGELFETTAVPEIRAQAEALALHLASI